MHIGPVRYFGGEGGEMRNCGLKGLGFRQGALSPFRWRGGEESEWQGAQGLPWPLHITASHYALLSQPSSLSLTHGQKIKLIVFIEIYLGGVWFFHVFHIHF